MVVGMKFSELMERVKQRGVEVLELRDGRTKVPTPWSDGSGGADPIIAGVCEDSRKVKPGDLFVARGGTKEDGAKYIADAVARGAVAIVAETIVDWPGVGSATVQDANLACAFLAHEIAGNPTADMKMIGITGTKGKTTVAYLLRSVLKAAGHKVGMIGTVEIDDGETTTPADMTTPGSTDLVNLFTQMKTNNVTHCIMEVSSHALHQHRTAGIDFAVAIFTNLTGDHLDYHKTMDDYATAKGMLFEGLKENAIAVVNADDKWVDQMVQLSKAKIVKYSVVDDEASLRASVNIWNATVTAMTPSVMTLEIKHGELHTQPFHLHTPLFGRHNASNLLAAIAAASEMKVIHDTIYRTLQTEGGAPGRLQRVQSPATPPQNLRIFVDYAHTHDALENVLNALRSTMQTEQRLRRKLRETSPWGPKIPLGPFRLICLFGCGGDRDRTKRPKMAAIAERLADLVFVTSDNPRTENPNNIIEEIAAGFSPNWQASKKITIQPDRRTAIRAAIAAAQPGDVVLLAGKGHENYQIIGTTKHHFDDVEEAQSALRELTP